MIKVKVDGQDQFTDLGDIKTIRELVDLVQASITPGTIINALTLNGAALTDADWRAPISVYPNATLEVTTGSRQAYVEDRIKQSPEVLNLIIDEFSGVCDKFRGGNSIEANVALKQAVDDLKAFLEWYNSVLQVMPEQASQQQSMFTNHVSTISKTCERIVQQHLYQSWWALGETIEHTLQPQLRELHTSCAQFSR